MGEISDPYKGLNKLKKRLEGKDPDIFDKKEVGILTGSGQKKPKKKDK